MLMPAVRMWGHLFRSWGRTLSPKTPPEPSSGREKDLYQTAQDDGDLPLLVAPADSELHLLAFLLKEWLEIPQLEGTYGPSVDSLHQVADGQSRFGCR